MKINRYGIVALGGLLILCSLHGYLGAALFAGEQSPEEIREKLERLPADRKLGKKAVLYSELGTYLYKKSLFADSIEAFESALQNGPSRKLERHIQVYLGKSYESIRRPDKAILSYERAVQLDKRNWKRHRDLAYLYVQVKLYRKALSSLERAIYYNSKESSLFLSQGEILRHLGFYRRAEESLIKGLDLGAPQIKTFRELSLAFEGMGRFSEAASAWNETLTEKSVDESWARLVYLSVLSGNFDLAKKGTTRMYERNWPEESIRFYEDLVWLMNQDETAVLDNRVNSSYLQYMINRMK